DDPQIAAYRDSVSKYYPNDPVGVFGLNGWSNASLFVKGFELLLKSGKPLTRSSLVEVMESMRNESVGGARGVSFEEGDHRGARQRGMKQAHSGRRFKLVHDFKP